MDPLTLLREIYGEEPIRKILTSGFDTVGKIAAATPDSLSYFTGLPEGLTAQIILAAEKALGRTGAGPTEEREMGPIRPRRPPPRTAGRGKAARREADSEPATPRQASGESEEARAAEDTEERDSALLDEDPLLDAGGVLKTFAARSQPREVFDDPDDILSEVGLTGAEAAFLDGIPSPWPNVPPPEEGSIPVLLAPPEPERAEAPIPSPSVEVELAEVTDWTPEEDPDPVPRIVRAAELGPGPEGFVPTPPARRRSSEEPGDRPASAPAKIIAAPADPRKRSFWKFGR